MFLSEMEHFENKTKESGILSGIMLTDMHTRLRPYTRLRSLVIFRWCIKRVPFSGRQRQEGFEPVTGSLLPPGRVPLIGMAVAGLQELLSFAHDIFSYRA